MIKTFRGQLDDDKQDRIRLQTIKGKVGYRIKKFQAMLNAFGDAEMILKIYTSAQATNTAEINFTDNQLLGAAMISGDLVGEHNTEDIVIIFDNTIFNQDIYITARGDDSGQPTNYYLELEVIPLDDAGAEYTTLKDFRQS